jgi:hypothetical protein
MLTTRPPKPFALSNFVSYYQTSHCGMYDVSDIKHRVSSGFCATPYNSVIISMFPLLIKQQNRNFGVIHFVHSHIIKHPLIIPTKCKMFIHYIHLTYYSCMFRCHIHHHQGELLCPSLFYCLRDGKFHTKQAIGFSYWLCFQRTQS